MTIKEFEFQYALGTLSYEDIRRIAITTTSKKILTTLSTYKHWAIKYYVYQNKNTPQKIKDSLSDDNRWGMNKE